ncbi:MAG: phosphoribosylglycinamide formyltransferase [Acidobacteria bacterium]|nr:phosphoribosylglycinamide formyltransferase [Acidobacteriota bacterium]
MTTPIAVLLSGRGSNFLALHRAIESGDLPARIVLVLSNRENAPGIAAAEDLGLPTAVLPHKLEPDRASHEAKVLAALRTSRAQWVCLAGYMRILSSDFVDAFPRRILNVHPSLLPSFPGVDAQRQALEHGVRVSGCTVHLVDGGLDSGPIVEQRVVQVLSDDTTDSLSARILEQEHRAYPSALGRLLTEPWHVVGRALVFANGEGSASAKKPTSRG